MSDLKVLEDIQNLRMRVEKLEHHSFTPGTMLKQVQDRIRDLENQLGNANDKIRELTAANETMTGVIIQIRELVYPHKNAAK